MYRYLLLYILVSIILLLVPFFSAGKVNAVPFGNYLILNGGTVNAESPSFSLLTSFEFEAWIKPQSIAGIKHILTIGNSENNTVNYQVGINGGSFSLSYRYNNSSLRSVTSGLIESGIWQHIRVTIDGVSTKLFVNGNQVISTGGGTNLNPAGPNIILGGGITGTGNFFGEIDHVQVSSNGNPLLIWNLDQSRGETIALDSSANAINGTLTGGDSKVHYFGILPTPTKFIFVLPTLPSVRRISIPVFPTNGPNPTGTGEQPSWNFDSDSVRSSRPVFPR